MSIIRQRKLRIEKMKKYMAAAGILLVILFLVLIKGLAAPKPDKDIKDGVKNLGKHSVVKEIGMEGDGKTVQQALPKTAVTPDMRRRNFDGIQLDPSISLGDCVDIRIRFVNGLDFVVLTKKEITGLIPSGGESGGQLELLVSEEEQLRMSSAFLDACAKQDTKIYAAEYLQEKQRAARPNYPIDPVIRELLYEDPNVTTAAVEPEESVLRHYIEELPDSSDNWEQGGGTDVDAAKTQDTTGARNITGTQDTTISQETGGEAEEFYYVD